MQLSSLVLSLLGTVLLCPWSVTADGGCELSFLRTLMLSTPLLTRAPFVVGGNGLLAYFDFIQPTSGQQFVDGAVNPLEWKKGLLDGVAMIDLELARLNSDGLLFVARNGTSKSPRNVTAEILTYRHHPLW